MSGPRRWLAPEVVQTSSMDCGPAALKCLLEGHGIPVSYGRLREACQTSVDGTSIDTIEAVANHLGLAAEQVLRLQTIRADVAVHHHAVEDGAAGFGGRRHGSGFRLVFAGLPPI